MKIVYLVGRDAPSRAAISYLFTERGYRCVGCDSVADLLTAFPQGRCCIAVDLDSAATELPELQRAIAAVGSTAPFVVFGTAERLREGLRALRQGAVDFIVRPFGPLELVVAMERAFDLASSSRDQPTARARALTKLRLLSNRELQILRGVLAGMSNKEMGLVLQISPRTIEMHRANMMADLQLRSQADAVRLAVDAGLQPLEPDAKHRAGASAHATLPNELKDESSDCVDTAAGRSLGVDELLEATTDGVFILDRQDRFTYLNQNAIETIAGGRNLVGECIWDIFPGARSTRAFPQMKSAVEETEPRRFDFFEPDLERWFDVSLRPVAEGLLVCFRDLTGEREALASARVTEEQLRQALAAAGDWSWDFDVAQGTTKVGQRFYSNLGLSEHQIGSALEELRALIHPEDLADFEHELDRHLRGKTDFYFCEYRMRSTSGEWRWHLGRGRVVSWDSRTGQPLRMLGVGSDITALKDLQRTSRAARERLALAQEHAGAGIWELDLLTGKLILCARSRRMFGIPEGKAELTGADWETIVHPSDVEPAKAAVAAAAATGAKLSHRFRVIRPDGTERTVLGLGKVVADSSRRLFLGLNLDLTTIAKAN